MAPALKMGQDHKMSQDHKMNLRLEDNSEDKPQLQLSVLL